MYPEPCRLGASSAYCGSFITIQVNDDGVTCQKRFRFRTPYPPLLTKARIHARTQTLRIKTVRYVPNIYPSFQNFTDLRLKNYPVLPLMSFDRFLPSSGFCAFSLFAEQQHPVQLTHCYLVTSYGDKISLAQVMACCPTAPCHYLNQCWLSIGEVLWHSPEKNFPVSDKLSF